MEVSQAFKTGKELSQTVSFAYRRRYGLTVTDPRYRDVSFVDMLLDYWAHAHWENPNLQAPMETEDFDEEFAALEREIEERIRKAREMPDEEWEPVVEDRFDGED